MMKNNQPVNTPRWYICNIIGQDKFTKLENAGFVVCTREYRAKRVQLLKELRTKIKGLTKEMESIQRGHTVP